MEATDGNNNTNEGNAKQVGVSHQDVHRFFFLRLDVHRFYYK